MSYPSSVDSFAGFTSGDTLAHDNHGAQENQQEAAIVAIENKVGIGASTPTSNTVLRGNGTGSSTYDQVHLATDVSGVLGAANGGTGSASGAYTPSQVDAAILAAKQALYPVGCVYIETTGTNPATTFGFGTWVAYGAGQTLIGVGTSDQTFTAGATGGESNHTLSASESGLPSHFHNYKFGSTAGGDGSAISTASTVGTQSVETAIIHTTAANASSSHNNLQPYIVTYFWKRTA